jgi:hypothetical protein
MMKPSGTRPQDVRVFKVACWLAFITLAVLLSYERVVENSFVWDTIPFVLLNVHVQELTLENVLWVMTHAHRANWQPITSLSHMIDFHLFGWDPAGHHLMNVAIHLMNSCLIYVVVAKLVGRAGTEDRWVTIIAGISALVFAIHPQHVESVAMVAQKKDTLYCFFALLSTICYINYTSSQRSGSRRAWYLSTFSFFTLSLLSKSMAVTLPVVFILLDVFPLGKVKERLSVECFSSLVFDKVPMLILSLVVSVITIKTQTIAMPSSEYIGLGERLVNTVHNLGFYQWKFFIPLNLSPYYPFPPIDEIFWPSYWLPALLFSSAVTVAGAVCWLRGFKALLIGWLVYLVTLSPVSGIIHVGPAASTDHYTYMATIPSCLLLGFLVSRVFQFQSLLKAITLAVAFTYLSGFALLTHAQVSVWKSPFHLWSRVLELHPGAALAHRNIAEAYISIGDYESALKHFKVLQSWELDVDVLILKALIDSAREEEARELCVRILGTRMMGAGDVSEEKSKLCRTIP